MRQPIPSGSRTPKLLTGSSSHDGGGPANGSKPVQNHNTRSRKPAKRAPPAARECCPATARTSSWPSPGSTGRQATIRRRSCGLPLKHAVRSAVDVCFHFTSRAFRDEALWSATERVWLGRRTFLHWAIWLADIDIPWTVSTAEGAPHDVEQLRGAVLAELASYWSEQLAALPRRKKPGWIPLP
jgi:hypothetical protein